MSFEIYIRPLRESDAGISFMWRNNPEVWIHTGSRPGHEITYEAEQNWIRDVLSRRDECRFAICIKGTDEYVGNVQLTKIHEGSGELHIFIGRVSYWGQGIGTSATNLMVEYAFRLRKLDSVYLYVRSENLAAIRAYEKVGFKDCKKELDGFKRFEIDRKSWAPSC